MPVDCAPRAAYSGRMAATWTAIGLLGAATLGMFGVVIQMGTRFDNRFDALTARIDERFAGSDARMDGMNARIDQLGSKIDLQSATLSARIDHLAERMDAQYHWHGKA